MRRSVSRGAVVLLSLFLAALLVVPALASTRKTIDLTGVVVGKTKYGFMKECAYPTKVSLLRGKHNEGAFSFTGCEWSSVFTSWEGTATLKVGKLSGKLELDVGYNCAVSCKYDTGTVSNSHGSENLRIKSQGLPTKKGTRFGVVLTP